MGGDLAWAGSGVELGAKGWGWGGPWAPFVPLPCRLPAPAPPPPIVPTVPTCTPPLPYLLHHLHHPHHLHHLHLMPTMIHGSSLGVPLRFCKNSDPKITDRKGCPPKGYCVKKAPKL